jgi:plasmid stability protein
MGVNLSIKDVSAELAARLRARAARNRRSLQRELMVIVERAAAEPLDEVSPMALGAAGRPSTVAFIQQGTKTIEQIAAEHRQRFPEPLRDGPMAVDIIRADRDSR